MAALRLAHGLCCGNEACAGLAYLSEHAPQLPCLHASLVPAGIAAGACAASAAALLFALVLHPAGLALWGWRLVLAASLLVNGASAALRGWLLRDPELHMSAAELADRRSAHLGRVIRCGLCSSNAGLVQALCVASGARQRPASAARSCA